MEKKGSTVNAIRSRWVLRWKKYPDGSKKVKARLVVKGFQDLDVKRIAVSSPTANKDSQRLINSLAVMKGWSVFTVDVSTAFI